MDELFKLDSQSKNILFRQVQETEKQLSNESILINDEISLINEKICAVRKRQLILGKKTDVVRLVI